MTQQYLSADELDKAIGEVSYDIEFVKTDSIDENAIIESIGENTQIMFCIAAQIAIVGIGGRNYNTFKYDGEELDLVVQMDKYGIKHSNTRDTALEPGDITPRRLCRVYRTHINKLLKTQKDISSYLWRKYTDHESSFRDVCFPGAEHLIESKHFKDMLIDAYTELDSSLDKAGKSSGLTERIERVFLARGI